MVQAQRLLADQQSASVERLGDVVAALRAAEHRQIGQDLGDIGVIGSVRCFCERQHLAIDRLRLAIAFLMAQRPSIS